KAGDARTGLLSLVDEHCPDVIYLDPMFPESKSSALNKQTMRFCRDVAGDDLDAGELLEAALETGCKRVVVKRMLKAPFLGDKPGTQSLLGKANRFDLYL
ncbi:MAG: class I SAM-dependent methyltransferase, partial [Deltaproteobacteria bacterium]|nr:class I SAM-dependent methyltransferase [Deltaproteobacteria bacterium]